MITHGIEQAIPKGDWAIVSADADAKECQTCVDYLREAFAPIMGEPIAVSYSDLMEEHLAEKEGEGS